MRQDLNEYRFLITANITAKRREAFPHRFPSKYTSASVLVANRWETDKRSAVICLLSGLLVSERQKGARSTELRGLLGPDNLGREMGSGVVLHGAMRPPGNVCQCLEALLVVTTGALRGCCWHLENSPAHPGLFSPNEDRGPYETHLTPRVGRNLDFV